MDENNLYEQGKFHWGWESQMEACWDAPMNTIKSYLSVSAGISLRGENCQNNNEKTTAASADFNLFLPDEINLCEQGKFHRFIEVPQKTT